MFENRSAGAKVLRRRGVLIVEQGGRGGVTDYSGFLAAGLAARGIPATIGTADDHLFPTTPGVRVVPVFHYVRGHSPTARLVRRARLGPLANGLRFLMSLPKLVALSRRHAVTHVQGWEAASLGLIAMLALRASGAVLVYTAHNTFERSAGLLDSTRVMPALSRLTIVHTEADRDRVSPPPAVIPHGHYAELADAATPVDPGEARAALGIAMDPLVVLLFGVLRPDKGIEDLLDAAADAPAWSVLIAGQEHGGLAAAAPRLASPRIASRVTVVEGFQPIEGVGQFFAAADLVALPYHRASQSGVLHLAYGFARPVVAYPVGGLTEAVLPGVTGWICSEATPRALAAALRDVGALGRGELRRAGQAARDWVEEQFDWGRIAAQTEAVYLRALRGDGIRAGRDGTNDEAGECRSRGEAPLRGR